MKEFELEPGEHIVREVRRHWFIFVMELLPFAILALLPLALPKLLTYVGPALPVQIPSLDLTSPLAHVFLGVWWLLMWCGAFNRFTDYYLDAWVITNLRIVDINQKGFFHRSVSSLLLNRIQDITVTAQGILVSLLDIGDINVQTAGSVERFFMRGIPHPAQLRDIILKYVPNNPAGV
ncbi:MAG: PH domain-containing protein [bacterium]|nr:PH domain-containing protein [bacterium]